MKTIGNICISKTYGKVKTVVIIALIVMSVAFLAVLVIAPQMGVPHKGGEINNRCAVLGRLHCEVKLYSEKYGKLPDSLYEVFLKYFNEGRYGLADMLGIDTLTHEEKLELKNPEIFFERINYELVIHKNKSSWYIKEKEPWRYIKDLIMIDNNWNFFRLHLLDTKVKEASYEPIREYERKRDSRKKSKGKK